MKEQLKKIKLFNLFFLTIAGIINAFGITIFLSPVNLYDSGISGTSMILAQNISDKVPFFSLSIFLILLNVPIFIYGLKKQGIVFTIYSIYSVLIYSLFAWLIKDVFPIDVSLQSPLAGKDLLLCAIFGGIISGIGSGLVIRFGGAIDGIEVLAVIFAKRLGITVGTFNMIYNVILYIIAGFILKDWILPLYSIVTYMAALKTIDFVIEGIDKSKAVTIVTEYQDEICYELSNTFKQGMSIMNVTGYYSNTQKKMIYIVLNRFQITKMKDITHEIDPNAYISISEVSDVFKAKKRHFVKLVCFFSLKNKIL